MCIYIYIYIMYVYIYIYIYTYIVNYISVYYIYYRSPCASRHCLAAGGAVCRLMSRSSLSFIVTAAAIIS